MTERDTGKEETGTVPTAVLLVIRWRSAFESLGRALAMTAFVWAVDEDNQDAQGEYG